MHHAQAASAGRVRYCERKPILRTAWILGVESGQHKILDRPIHAKARSGSTGRSARCEPTSSTNASSYWGWDERTTRRAVARAKGTVAGRPPSYLPAVDRRARSLVAVRLGIRPEGAWSGRWKRARDAVVLRMAGVVPLLLTDNDKTDDHRLGHRDRGPSPQVVHLDRAATFSGTAATSTATVPVQARARPRPRYLTLYQRPLHHGT